MSGDVPEDFYEESNDRNERLLYECQHLQEELSSIHGICRSRNTFSNFLSGSNKIKQFLQWYDDSCKLNVENKFICNLPLNALEQNALDCFRTSMEIMQLLINDLEDDIIKKLLDYFDHFSNTESRSSQNNITALILHVLYKYSLTVMQNDKNSIDLTSIDLHNLYNCFRFSQSSKVKKWAAIVLCVLVNSHEQLVTRVFQYLRSSVSDQMLRAVENFMKTKKQSIQTSLERDDSTMAMKFIQSLVNELEKAKTDKLECEQQLQEMKIKLKQQDGIIDNLRIDQQDQIVNPNGVCYLSCENISYLEGMLNLINVEGEKINNPTPLKSCNCCCTVLQSRNDHYVHVLQYCDSFKQCHEIEFPSSIQPQTNTMYHVYLPTENAIKAEGCTIFIVRKFAWNQVGPCITISKLNET